jgi:hypothetical protein
MSSPTRMTSTATATIWRSNGADKYGRKSYDAPQAFLCTFDETNDNKFVDSQGVEFVPSVVAWYEDDGSEKPKEGDYIAKGDQTAILDPTDTENALPVKLTKVSDCSMLNEPDDIMVGA